MNQHFPYEKQFYDALNQASHDADLDELSDIFHRSPAQLNRDFYAVTGYSVHEYQRYRRLSQALCLIKHSDMTLADISYYSGYSSQQAMCREIRDKLGMTATEYRTWNGEFFLSDPDTALPYPVEVSTVPIPQTVCLRFYHPVLSGLESLAVQTFLSQNPHYSGRLFGRNGVQRGSRFCYELFAEPTVNLNTDGFCVGETHDAYRTFCAHTRVKNQEEDINGAWDWLYSEWLSKSMFVYADAQTPSFENAYFEEYHYKGTTVRRLGLYLPILPQNGFLRVTLERHTVSFLAAECAGISADTDASRLVLHHLAQVSPGVFRHADRFYYREEDGRCICGVMIAEPVPYTKPLQILRYDDTPFAVLHYHGTHPFQKAAGQLLVWMESHGLRADGVPFAVYDTADGDDCPNMKLFCPIKND